jgi:hypothetical protein
MAGKIKYRFGYDRHSWFIKWLRGDGSWVSLLNKEEISNK